MGSRHVTVASHNELTEMVIRMTWDRQYTLVSQDPGRAVLRKSRPKGLHWVIGFVLFPPTLAVWALWWAIRPDGRVVATVGSDAVAPAVAAGQLSPDGTRRWNGAAWVEILPSPGPGRGSWPKGEVVVPGLPVPDPPIPPPAGPGSFWSSDGPPISPDGTRYWDGQSWRPVSG